MKKAIGGRQTGKSTKLIKLSAETKVPIITRDISSARILQEQAKEMGLNIEPPIPIGNIARNITVRGFVPQRSHVLVDDAEHVLQVIFNELHTGTIDAIAISTDDMNDELI